MNSSETPQTWDGIDRRGKTPAECEENAKNMNIGRAEKIIKGVISEDDSWSRRDDNQISRIHTTLAAKASVFIESLTGTQDERREASKLLRQLDPCGFVGQLEAELEGMRYELDKINSQLNEAEPKLDNPALDKAKQINPKFITMENATPDTPQITTPTWPDIERRDQPRGTREEDTQMDPARAKEIIEGVINRNHSWLRSDDSPNNIIPTIRDAKESLRITLRDLEEEADEDNPNNEANQNEQNEIKELLEKLDPNGLVNKFEGEVDELNYRIENLNESNKGLKTATIAAGAIAAIFAVYSVCRTQDNRNLSEENTKLNSALSKVTSLYTDHLTKIISDYPAPSTPQENATDEKGSTEEIFFDPEEQSNK